MPHSTLAPNPSQSTRAPGGGWRRRRVQFRLGDVEVDVRGQRLWRGDRVQRLTTREAQLLAYLAARPGCVVSREELLTRVWGFHRLSQSRAVDKAVNRLRAKIEVDSADPEWLQTVHGEGYVLNLTDQAAPRFPRVPRPVQDLHGREAVTAELAEWWADGSAVAALMGVAGIGKSLVARHFAWGLSGRGGAVVVADLSGLSRLGEACRAVARAAGLPPVRTPAELARRFEDPLRMLLVLDHVDGLDGDLAELVDPLVGLVPGLSVLVVGRARPRGLRYRLVRVGPLEVEAAEALVAEVVGTRTAGGDRWHPRLVRDLVRRLEGNPAALRAAAALARDHGAGEVLAMIGGSDRVLAFPPVPARALEKAVGASWRALDAQGRRDLARLARLPDGFTRADALQVLDGDERRARRALADLADRSLLAVDLDPYGRRRYRLPAFLRALVRARPWRARSHLVDEPIRGVAAVH